MTISLFYSQSNAAVSQEMKAMKAQIASLTNMLKASLELQMDIQRSIRQEVAAAINQSAAHQGNNVCDCLLVLLAGGTLSSGCYIALCEYPSL